MKDDTSVELVQQGPQLVRLEMNRPASMFGRKILADLRAWILHADQLPLCLLPPFSELLGLVSVQGLLHRGSNVIASLYEVCFQLLKFFLNVGENVRLH